MSRTKHHRGQRQGHWGHDLWSKRGGMAGAAYNAYNKLLTRRKERAAEKSEIARERDEV